MKDQDIIALFFERSEQAIEALILKYGAAIKSVASNILKNTQDAEECCSDTYLTVWNQIPQIEITDRFDADGVCFLELRDGDEVLYVTVKKGNGMMVSSKAYVQPWQFSITKEP